MIAYILCTANELSQEYAAKAAKSCEKYGLKYEMFCNISDIKSEEITERYGYKLGSYNPTYNNEYSCTIGHIQIWDLIAKSGEVGIVLEHDTLIVSDQIHNIKPREDEILFLGPRVFSENDYSYPEGEELEYFKIKKFQGTHAYALTPETARKIWEQIDSNKFIPQPVDGIFGINNLFKKDLVLVDPPVAVAEIGQRKSFTNGRVTSTSRTVDFVELKYNEQHLAGFLRGVKETEQIGYQFSVDWFSEHIPHWEKSLELAKLKKEDKHYVLEIGSYEGKSSTWISDNLLNHPDSKMFCVDTFTGGIEHRGIDFSGLQDRFMHNIRQSKNFSKIQTFPGTSSMAMGLMIIHDFKYDIIYIDGSHETDDVIIDGIHAFKLLSDNGIIIFDDYQWTLNDIPTVRNATIKLEELLPIEPILTGWQRTYRKRRA
jgi:hypothetical protein